MEEIARDVALVPMTLVNAYLVGNAQSWVLVDAGSPGNAKNIREAAEARFGPGAKPQAIVLTHGHFDHAGSVDVLAEMWDVKVYAHRLEWPYLGGKAYPPMDPTAPGFFSAVGRFLPKHTVNITTRLMDLANKLPSVGMQDWEAIDTPGHSPGHVCFFRRSDGLLLAGDAFVTVNMDSFFDLIAKKKKISPPPATATPDWPAARNSVRSLAALRPRLIATGHGAPMSDAADELQRLADNFPLPEHGRYVNEPARADETGVTYLPPAPPDNVPKIAAGVAAGVVLAAIGAALLKKKS